MSALATRETLIAPGDTAPDFTLKTQDRADWTLSDAVKAGDVILCFYPLAFTGVCGTEMNCISKDLAQWTAKGAQVVGVSCDSFAANKAWAEKEGFKHTLLSDMHRQVCKEYGLYWADLNVSKRGTVVIGKDPSGRGKVKWSESREPGNAMKWEDVLARIA
ncbi:MAG: redoxin domain-containing protein [Phycisphaeraceae bacterium]|nr:redoxin domain-containing protein [Phycisphaeraceae bacterium]